MGKTFRMNFLIIKETLFSRCYNWVGKFMGQVAALIISRMNGLLPFESTVEQTTETMPLTQVFQ